MVNKGIDYEIKCTIKLKFIFCKKETKHNEMDY